MTKQEFIQKVAQKSGLSNRDAGKAVDAFMESVTETLKAGDSVNFTGFGKFSPAARAARRVSTRAPASASRSPRRPCRSSGPAASSRRRSRASRAGQVDEGLGVDGRAAASRLPSVALPFRRDGRRDAHLRRPARRRGRAQAQPARRRARPAARPAARRAARRRHPLLLRDRRRRRAARRRGQAAARVLRGARARRDGGVRRGLRLRPPRRACS